MFGLVERHSPVVRHVSRYRWTNYSRSTGRKMELLVVLVVSVLCLVVAAVHTFHFWMLPFHLNSLAQIVIRWNTADLLGMLVLLVLMSLADASHWLGLVLVWVYKEVLRYLEPPRVYKISPRRQFWLAGPQLELISNWSSPYFGEWVIWGNFYIRASSYREGGGFFQAKKKDHNGLVGVFGRHKWSFSVREVGIWGS